MNILGVHSITHDVGAALFQNNQLSSAVEEERLSRIKHHPGIQFRGSPPYKSIKFLLQQSSLKMNDVNLIVHVGWPGSDDEPLDVMKRVYRDFAKTLDKDLQKTIFVDHHHAHAASSYYASGFDKALVIVIDGHGDYISTSIYIGEGLEKPLKKIADYHVDQSLGIFYTRAAKTLGLGNLGFGEGKMMALASYGKVMKDFLNIITFENGRYQIGEYKELFRKFERKPYEKIKKIHKDFAATIQYLLTTTVLRIIKEARERYPFENICISGGVGLNCSMNSKISELLGINLFIPPAPNDGGLCIGAAYIGAVNMGLKINRFNSPYLGPEIEKNSLGSFIRKNGLRAKKIKNSYKRAAKLISEGYIVGWMQGKLEFGPRALGHRSLLGDPRLLKVKDRINWIKGRDLWRPVALSLVGNENLESPIDCMKYMTIATKIKPELASKISAGIHKDGTSRVQIVNDRNDSFYKLITSFEKITGIPAILNTSLNSRDEPLCTSIEDGVRFFYTSQIDYLFIGDWLLEK